MTHTYTDRLLELILSEVQNQNKILKQLSDSLNRNDTGVSDT